MAFLILRTFNFLLALAGRAGYPFKIIFIVEPFVALRGVTSGTDGYYRFPGNNFRVLRCCMVFTGAVTDFAAYLLQLGRQREECSIIVADLYVFIFCRDMTGKAVKVELLLLSGQCLVS